MNNPYLSLLRTGWNYAREYKLRYVLVYGMFTVDSLIASLDPLLFGWFIDALQREGAQPTSVAWLYVLIFIGLHLVKWGFHGPARIMESDLSFNVSRNFMDEKYHQLLHLPVKWHQDHHSGATISRIRKAYEGLRHFFQNGFGYISALTKFIFAFGAMLYFSPVFGAVGVLIGAFTWWVIQQFDKPYTAAVREVNEREHDVSSILFDSLSNIITIITLRLENRFQVGFRQKILNIFPPLRRNVTINEWRWFTSETLIGIMYGTIIIGYVYQNKTQSEAFYIGGLVALVGYAAQFITGFYELASRYTQVVQYDTDVKSAAAIGEVYRNQSRRAETQPLPANWKHIEIRELNFCYKEPVDGEDRRPHGLYDVNFRLERGKKIALVGESGSGKSTLLSLVRGLYTPQDGAHLWIDDKPEVKFERIGHGVTLFPQEPEIFENTILYNITLGLPFDEEEVWKVCRLACFTEIVNQLPGGLHTHIQEKGVNLSGGQKQRLALARGILAARNSSIVLLDEPTSSLDSKTEQVIYENLFEAFADKAVVSSIHHRHLFKKFDYIYLMHAGRIIEEGPYEKLHQNKSAFEKLLLQ